MTIFLTSSPTGPLDGSRPVHGYDTWNSFCENLKKYWPENARVLMITASPDSYAQNDGMIDYFREATTAAGFSFSRLDLMDRRYFFDAEEISTYDVVFLGGGHTPTQNQYFHETDLIHSFSCFEGLVIGISAGSMNCANTVYFQPELPGEAADPNFPRYAPGLGLTDQQILPHYQMVRDTYYDGISYADANFPYSVNHPQLVLCDGSYLLSADGIESVWGEAYMVENGVCRQICEHNQHVIF